MSTVPDKKGEKPTEDKKEEKTDETPQDKNIDETSTENKEGEAAENKEGEAAENKEGEAAENKEGEEAENKEGEGEELEKKTFNNKSLENTTKTVNKVNFSRSRELADKYAGQLIDSAERYGKGITLDKVKEKLGKDLFRNLKQTSLKYFFDFVSKYSNTSVDIINDVFKSASIDLEEDGLTGVLSAKNRMRGNILLMFLLDRLNFALTNEKTRNQLKETSELFQQFANETFMAIITTIRENKKLLEDTMESVRPIIRDFIVTIISAALQGLMVGVATAGPIGAPANLWFQGSKVVNEIAPKLGAFADNVGNIIDKYDQMLGSLSEKGEPPLKRFRDIKAKINGFSEMISSVQQDAALIDAIGKTT